MLGAAKYLETAGGWGMAGLSGAVRCWGKQDVGRKSRMLSGNIVLSVGWVLRTTKCSVAAVCCSHQAVEGIAQFWGSRVFGGCRVFVAAKCSGGRKILGDSRILDGSRVMERSRELGQQDAKRQQGVGGIRVLGQQ